MRKVNSRQLHVALDDMCLISAKITTNNKNKNTLIHLLDVRILTA